MRMKLGLKSSVCSLRCKCRGGAWWDLMEDWKYGYKFVGEQPKPEEHIFVFFYEDKTMDRGVDGTNRVWDYDRWVDR